MSEPMNRIASLDGLRAAMGRNGRHYVRQNYRWDVILGKYERMFAKLRGAAKLSPRS